MPRPLPVTIVATSCDLAALERAVTGGRGPGPGPVSVQIDTLDPNVALAAQKAINAGSAATGWPEALAAAVSLAGLAAGCGLALGAWQNPASVQALGAVVAVAAAGGAGLGRAVGLIWARRRAVRAVALLRRHTRTDPVGASLPGRPANGTVLPSICLF
jgi:hypothetical protein